MCNKRKSLAMASLAGLLILILDSRTTVEGAKNGLMLCLQTVIPSLFPFFLLSNVVLDAFSGASSPLLRPLGRFCGIPAGAEAILIPAFLGGYPVGAQCVAQACQDGRITRADARRLLSFCNNAGPSFLFGIVGSMFTQWYAPWLLWGIHIASALLWAVLTGPPEMAAGAPAKARGVSLPQAMEKAISTMASVCGWVILFRVLIAFLERWFLWLLPRELKVLIMGFLELSNGCCTLRDIGEEKLRFLICSGMLAFGGCCVLLQTETVIGKLGLGSYLKGKLMQTIFSLSLCVGFLYHIWWLFPAIILALLLKKAVAFQKILRYNGTITSGRTQYAVSKKDGKSLCLLPLCRATGRRPNSLRQKGLKITGG